MCTCNGYLNMYPICYKIKVCLEPGNIREEALLGIDIVWNSTLQLGYYPLKAKGTECWVFQHGTPKDGTTITHIT
jgi:hypothetical protein